MTKGTILIVDDIEANRETLESLLDYPELELHYAADGATALAKAAKLQPDLVLLDVMMPGMDGFEVCVRLRADPRIAEVPIIMVTSLDDRKSRLRGIEAGADDFVSKPFDRVELRARINGILRLNRFRRMQEASEQIRAQAALIDLAPDAIMVCDFDERITYWNAAAEHLYGWPAQNAIGQRVDELLSSYNDEADFGEGSFSDDEWRREICQFTRERKEIVVESRRKLLRDAEGRPKAMLVINTDLTGKKQLEAQFLRMQRLDSIGTLATGIAHDLNNVLAPIVLLVEPLKTKCADSEAAGMLSVIAECAQRGGAMVKQVLSFGCGTNGQRVEIQVKRLIQAMQQVASDTFLKHAQVRANVPDDLWTLRGDPTQLHQVLMNLCVNARDAMPRGGELTISAENLTIDALYSGLSHGVKPGPYILLQVQDTGAGMPPEIIARIFDPFFTTKEIGKGAGVGLSTTLGIVKKHGGFIDVSSEVGKGTTFKVYFPAMCEGLADTTVESTAELPGGNGELVLVVDDEATVREVIKQTLEAFGYRVVVAADGVEAVAIMVTPESAIAAAFVDMTMPVMDGRTTVQILRRLNPQLPIVVASGLASSQYAEEMSNFGVKRLLAKPFSTETLLTTLREAVKG